MEILNLIGFVVGVLSAIVTVASLVYAIKTNREKDALERLVQFRFQHLAWSIGRGKKLATLAYGHLDEIRHQLQRSPPSESLDSALDKITWLHGDVTSVDRLLEEIAHDIESTHYGMFGVAMPAPGKKGE